MRDTEDQVVVGYGQQFLLTRPSVIADAEIVNHPATALRELGIPVSRGAVRTTDAPCGGTEEQLAQYAKQGVLAVEMQAASLFAFAIARRIPVGMVADVTNAVDHDEDPFKKRSHTFGQQILETMCRAAKAYLGRTTSASHDELPQISLVRCRAARCRATTRQIWRRIALTP